ncbi:MAG: DUF4058 family protein [Cyanobacteria bacterium J06636_16]
MATTLTTVYDEVFYNLSIDYNQEPPHPPLSDSDRTWAETLIHLEVCFDTGLEKLDRQLLGG